MPQRVYPVPDGYIVWRENDGTYAIAKRPTSIVLHGQLSRTSALSRLYLLLQKQASRVPFDPEDDSEDS